MQAISPGPGRGTDVPSRRGRGALLLAAALMCAGCGGSTQHGRTSEPPPRPGRAGAPGHRQVLHIAPAAPTPRSELAYTFTAPVAAGRHGRTVVAYSLSVTGPASRGCIGADEAGSPPARAGERVTIADGPAQTHRLWCPGHYTARVLELARAACTSGQVCPQYIRVVATVAAGAFTVRG